MPTPIGLREDQRIARARAGILAHMLGPAGADHRQAIDGFRTIDRVTARDRYPRRCAHRRAAFQNLPHHLRRDLVDRHAENGERHDRLAAHGINIRDRVGRRDASEVERVIHHRHEEIRRGDDAGVVIELPHRRVVGRLRPDQQLLERRDRRLVGEQLLQHRWRQLAATAAAMR